MYVLHTMLLFPSQNSKCKKVSLFHAFVIFFTAAQKLLHTTGCYYILCSTPLLLVPKEAAQYS
jgi:hypothetical protein